MKRWLALFIACLSLGLVAVGCGGDDDDDSGGDSAKTTEQPAEKTEPTGGGAAGPKVEVGMKGLQFDPKNVTVAKGGTVTWTNNESVSHDVTWEDGPGLDFSSGNGNMKQGDTYKQTFKTAGKINYVCTIHPNMTGTVTVQ